MGTSSFRRALPDRNAWVNPRCTKDLYHPPKPDSCEIARLRSLYGILDGAGVRRPVFFL